MCSLSYFYTIIKIAMLEINPSSFFFFQAWFIIWMAANGIMKFVFFPYVTRRRQSHIRKLKQRLIIDGPGSHILHYWQGEPGRESFTYGSFIRWRLFYFVMLCWVFVASPHLYDVLLWMADGYFVAANGIIVQAYAFFPQ